jgi:acetoin utilization protein AcuB
MRIDQWMTRELLTVESQAAVDDARVLLKENRINQLPVTREGRLVGIVTDRDLRSAPADAEGAIADVMTANPITVQPHESMQRAAVLMRRKRIGALPVVRRGELLGIVTRTDVLRAFLALASYDRRGRGQTPPWHEEPRSKATPPRHV